MTASTLTAPITDSSPEVDLLPYTAAVVLTDRRFEVVLGDSSTQVLDSSGNEPRGTSLEIVGDIILALADLLPSGGKYIGIGFVFAEQIAANFGSIDVADMLTSTFDANVVVDTLPNSVVMTIDDLRHNADDMASADILYVFANKELTAAFTWNDGNHQPISLGGPTEDLFLSTEIDRFINTTRRETGPFTSDDWIRLVTPLVDAIERLHLSTPCDIIVFGGDQPINRRRLQQAFRDVVAARAIPAWVLTDRTDGKLGAAALQAAVNAISN